MSVPDTRTLLSRWSAVWGTPGLEDSIALRFSDSLRRSLGRCRPAAGRITLSGHLRDEPALLAEVLCHEAAHVAAYRLHGPVARPHGNEWRALVEAAGFEPRTRAASKEKAVPPRVARRALHWEHRCPVCHAVRLARRPVPQWRCAACLDAGLPGTMVITRLSGAGAGGHE